MVRKRRQALILIPAGLVLACILLLLGVLISNRRFPESSTVVERLSVEEKARLAEIFHLRHTLGDEVWPGWQQAPIPLVVFNESYVFLVGYPGEPPAGWERVPQGTHHGGAWERVVDDTFQGEPYYRQSLPADGTTPQAFTVRIGEAWAASLQTKEWMNISFVRELREQLPGFLRPLVPNRLIVNLFLGGSDKYVSLFLHESFHAYQGQIARQRLAAAESDIASHEAAYPWQDETSVQMWQDELDLLRDALRAETAPEQAELVDQFLAQRAERRERVGLNAELITYEQEREWQEGLAKYVEMESWRQAAAAGNYAPDPATQGLTNFEGYDNFSAAWDREVDQIARMAEDEGDGRFYYSGMAQATLLDALRPGWKATALTTDVTLEGLLRGETPAQEGNGDQGPASASSRTDGQVVELYYGNSRRNSEADCSAVFPVTRTVPADAYPAFAALDQLFAGPTVAEKADGYTSWFSDETANALLSLKLAGDGTAYVNLADMRQVIPNASTSCGSQSFFAQVETTLRGAEPGIRRVIYAIEGRPRPFYEWMQIGCTPANDNCDPEPFRE